MPTPTRLAIILLALFTAFPLHAGVFSHDFLTPGDGLLTYDDVNQREWLDLTETTDWSLGDLQKALLSNGPLNEFTLANKEDISSLAASAGVEWLPPGQLLPVVEGNSPKNLIELVGVILDYSKSNEQDDHFNDFDDLVEIDILQALSLRASVGVVGDILLGELDVISYNSISVISIGDQNSGNTNSPLITTFSGGGILSNFQPLPAPVPGPFWLYRTAVPEPTSIALLTFGAIAVLATRSRHR